MTIWLAGFNFPHIKNYDNVVHSQFKNTPPNMLPDSQLSNLAPVYPSLYLKLNTKHFIVEKWNGTKSASRAIKSDSRGGGDEKSHH